MRWAVVSIAAILLVGCSAGVAELPDAVTVTAYQGRFDRAERQLELKVTNGTDATITVTSAALESTRFLTPAIWDRHQDIPPGAARDLRVELSEPACTGTPARDEVVLTFTLADGSSGTSRLAIDDVSAIDAINAEDCLTVAVASLATIRASDTVEWTPGAQAPATLELTVTPTGASGWVKITETRATVLLSLVDDGGLPVFSQPQTVLVDANAEPAIIQLRLIPARCDPHAVAEDKRGTIFPLQVSTSLGADGQVAIPVGDAVRAELYAFYGDYCGLP